MERGGVLGDPHHWDRLYPSPCLETGSRPNVVRLSASGKSVDLALVLADAKPGQTIDPASAAHTLPVSYWAQAVWSALRPLAAMAEAVRAAQHRIDTSKSTWAVVSGPAAALLATAARIGWCVLAFDRLIDDNGVEYPLRRESPALVAGAVVESVRRWQIRQIAATFPAAQLDCGIRIEPVFDLH